MATDTDRPNSNSVRLSSGFELGRLALIRGSAFVGFRKLTPAEQIELDSTAQLNSRLKQFDAFFHRLKIDDQLLPERVRGAVHRYTVAPAARAVFRPRLAAVIAGIYKFAVLKSLFFWLSLAAVGAGFLGIELVYLALIAGPAGFNKLMVVKIMRQDLLDGSGQEQISHVYERT